MKVLKQAVQYYCDVTGKSWESFYDNLQDGFEYQGRDNKELWLVHELLKVAMKTQSMADILAGKDDVKGVFDKEGRKNAGEFFTPLKWAAEGRKYFDKYIPNWKDYYIWDGCCYTMNTKLYIRRTELEIMNTTGFDIVRKVKEGFMTYLEGWIDYSHLMGSDFVLTINKDGTTRWSGIYSQFSNDFTGDLLHFYVNGEYACSVTYSHMMFCNGVRVRADEVEIDAEVFLEDNSVGHVTNIVREHVENNKVWDLTTYDDNHTFLVKAGEFGIFSGNCGSGNLLKEAETPNEKKFLSTLEQSDIDNILAMPEFEGVNAFQLDFLSCLDYDMVNTEFLNKLPERLQEIIRNDEPVIFYFNPPYKSGMAKATDVGRYMIDIGLGDSAYDLFYQCCWRVMHLVETYGMSNMYFCFFGPLTFFSGTKASVLNKEFQKCFEYINGMCIPAQSFSGTSESISWGLGCTLWKSRGMYDDSVETKGILLETKEEDTQGNIIMTGHTLYTIPREDINKWVQPADVLFYNNMPLASSHLTFKGSDVFSKEAKKSGRMAENALGTMMLDNTLARGNTYSAILSVPSSVQYVDITEENFWRCVANFSFRNAVNNNWADARKWQSAPDTTVEGYEEWLMNALVLFLCELKSMQSSLRDIHFDGDIIDIPNKLFYVSADEVRKMCKDTTVLADLDKHTIENTFLLEQIEKARSFWYPECEDLYNWCKAYILYSLNEREKYGYKGSLESWDAGMAQLRSVMFTEDLNKELYQKLALVRGRLSKDVDKFGFLSENMAE